MEDFFGRFVNTLDAKGRINMPARYRETAEKSGNGDQTFILTRGSERCIVMFPLGEWRRKIRELERLVPDGAQRRIINRRMNYYASHQKVDKQGRINIPADLIEYAGLDREVVVLGTGKRIEIWNPDELQKYLEAGETTFQDGSNVLDF